MSGNVTGFVGLVGTIISWFSARTLRKFCWDGASSNSRKTILESHFKDWK